MLQRVVAAGLEHIHEPDDVGFDIGMRVFDRVAHAGLRREMHDPLGRGVGKNAIDGLPIGDVDLVKTEPLMRQQPRESRLFQGDVVVIVKIVYANDFVTIFPCKRN